jgi:MipA family protein
LRRRPKPLRLQLSAVALVTLAVPTARADEAKPLWEFGLGIGAYAFNDYRGSDTTHAYPIPVPYFIYRGEILKSDHDGPRARFFNRDVVELNLSINATTPVRNDAARAGMPDLRPTIEVGGSLNFHLWRSQDQRVRLDLRLPVRTAITVETSPKMIGVYAEPHINLDIAQLGSSQGWKLGVLAGPLFADHRYDSYFYGVEPQYATPERPAYEAHGGYAGTQMLMSLTRRYPKYWIGAFIRHDFLGGASFASSPLVKTNDYWSGGIGITWMIRQSAHAVTDED